MSKRIDRERVGELRRARGVLFDEVNGKVKLLKTSYTKDELLLLVRTLGKRAQSRIASLAKDFDEKGRRYKGQHNAIYTRYKDYRINTAGLSTQALRMKVKQAVDILNSAYSTISGYNAARDKAFETFKVNHPKLKNISREDWQKYVLYMASFQQAHEEEQYDSEQLLQYTHWAYEGSAEGTPKEDADLDTLNDWFLDRTREETTGTWFDLTEDFDDI